MAAKCAAIPLSTSHDALERKSILWQGCQNVWTTDKSSSGISCATCFSSSTSPERKINPDSKTCLAASKSESPNWSNLKRETAIVEMFSDAAHTSPTLETTCLRAFFEAALQHLGELFKDFHRVQPSWAQPILLGDRSASHRICLPAHDSHLQKRPEGSQQSGSTLQI